MFFCRADEHLENYKVSEEHYLVASFIFAASLIGIKSAYSGYESGLYGVNFNKFKGTACVTTDLCSL